MKNLRSEVVDFVSVISRRELKRNPVLRRKVKNLHNFIKGKTGSENTGVLKFLSKKHLLKTMER